MEMQNNKEEQNKVVKAAAWYTISNMILRGISLFTAPIFTRLLSTSDYGIVSNFTSWTNIVFCVTGLGLSTSVVRGKIEFKNEFKKYLSSIQALGIISGLVAFFIMIPSLSFWSELMEMDKCFIVIMLGYLLIYPSVGFMQTNYRFEYRYKENIFISLFSTIGNVACSIGLILMYGEYRYVGRIIGSILPIFILGIIYASRIFYEGRCLYNKFYWKYALRIGIPMIPHSLAMIVLGQIDRTMIIKYCGESEAGIYSFGYSYGILMATVTNALNDAIQPMIFEYIEAKENIKLNNLLKKVCSLVSVLIVIVIAVGPEALRILGTEDYYSGRWVIYPVVVGTMFQFFYQSVACIEIYHKKTKIIAVGSVGAAVINLCLNAVFIPRYGFIAAGYTTLAGYFLLLIYHCIGAYFVVHRNLIQNKIWFETSMVPVIFGGMLLWNYDNWTWRYVFLAIYVFIVAIKYKDDIKSLISGIKEKRSKI